ncbi:MAG: PEPxxWA-CTERM sorting domain-containing protein [Caulobacteraceae bacterium]
MKLFTLATAALGAVSLLALAAPAQAVTFADYSATNSNANLQWTKTTKTTGSLSTTGVGDTASVYFSFLNPVLASLKNIAATFTLSASSNTAAFTDTSGDIVQPGLGGTFSFVYSGLAPLTVGGHTYTTGTDLLSGDFSGAEIVGSGSVGVAKDSILSGGNVTFTTGIDASQLAFSNAAGSDKGFSLELTSATPLFARSGKVMRTFSANSTGGFSALLTAGGGGGVPEPATWAMLIAGFAMVGYAVRRRPVKLAFA